MANSRYLTTTLPYVNAEPHLGFALELVQADALARYERWQGRDVFLNTGTDEHGVKIFRQAEKNRQPPEAYVAAASKKFKDLLPALGVLPEANFIRTTDPAHIAAAQEFWRRVLAVGDIYKKNYRIKYCAGCELEKTESELVNGGCPLHPDQALESIEEENYFFRFSRYRERLLKLYAERPDFVVPATRLNEVKKFVERGLKDFSLSRLKSKMPWGIPVPDDPDQVMYVWFDALVNYVAAVGWPDNLEKFNYWWPVTQFAGKDNLRQQAAMWQAMLMSTGLPPTRQIVIHGFITAAGQKMSKSLGNVVDPFVLVDEYGADAVRYYLLRHVHPFEDSDFTAAKFKEAYNANLANGLGNLVSRVMKLAGSYRVPALDYRQPMPEELENALDHFEFNQAMDIIWQKIGRVDQKIDREKPFALVRKDRVLGKVLIGELINELSEIAKLLVLFLPATADSILNLIKTNSVPSQPLFPRR